MVAQQVTASPQINLRADRAYYLIGQVDESILLFRDQGGTKLLNIFEPNMVLSSERNVNLLSDRSLVYDVINQDSVFSVFYGFRDEDEVTVYMDVFNANANRVDSVEIFRDAKSFKALQYETVISEDRNILALYNITSKDELTLLVFDIAKRKVIVRSKYQIAELNLVEEIMQIEVSNEGELVLLYEKNNYRGDKENHFARFLIFLSNGKETEDINIPLKGLLCSDLMFKIDNRNRKLALTGLYDEKDRDQSSGYVWVNGSIDSWGDEDVYFIPFEEVIFFEVYGDDKAKKLKDFKVGSILLKDDGSPILIFELSRDVLRQNGVVNSDGFNALPYRVAGRSAVGWSDHYREDLVVISLKENLVKDWHHVFYKKQFSQNDDGLFSSYFTFMTPSRVRLIYNDEIKTNSTVSEYIFDGAGNYKRNSLLSTEYQNLRLIFNYATQISNQVMIVPSQRNSSLSLVKVDYSQ